MPGNDKPNVDGILARRDGFAQLDMSWINQFAVNCDHTFMLNYRYPSSKLPQEIALPCPLFPDL